MFRRRYFNTADGPTMSLDVPGCCSNNLETHPHSARSTLETLLIARPRLDGGVLMALKALVSTSPAVSDRRFDVPDHPTVSLRYTLLILSNDPNTQRSVADHTLEEPVIPPPH